MTLATLHRKPRPVVDDVAIANDRTAWRAGLILIEPQPRRKALVTWNAARDAFTVSADEAIKCLEAAGDIAESERLMLHCLGDREVGRRFVTQYLVVDGPRSAA